MMINIITIDDHPFVGMHLKDILNAEPDMHLVYSATHCDSLIKKVKKLNVSVAIFDIRMPLTSGIDCCRILKARYPGIKVIALTGENDTGLLHQMWQAGANGFILKSDDLTELPKLIRKVMHTQCVISSSVPEFFSASVSEEQPVRLTKSEKEVLKLYGQGHTLKEIADIRCVSADAIAFHSKQIRMKFNKNTLNEVIEFVRKAGML